MTPKEFFEFAKKNGAGMVDLKFVDLLGTWQHCTFPVDFLDEKAFQEGLGFDGSSIRGWKPIHQSDMMAVPDLSTVVMDPFFAKPTLSVIADVVDPLTREEYNRDPGHAKSGGVCEEDRNRGYRVLRPEPVLHLRRSPLEQNQHTGMYVIDSAEGSWNTARFEEPNLGYKPSYKGGYFPVSPTDTQQDIRTEMVEEMRKVGIVVEKHHHEVATGGQAEIDMLFAPLVEQADKLMWYKYIVKNVAKRHGKTATFMPKPIFQDNGSGMHTHFSLWKGNKNLFAGKGYAGLSDMALHAIAGLIHHAPAILAFAAPTTTPIAGWCRVSRPGEPCMSAGTAGGLPHPDVFPE
jgi:glutamine synthetase